MRKHGITPRVPTIHGSGEQIQNKVKPGTVHIARAINVLDSAMDPFLAIENVLEVLKLGGIFHILAAERLGERELHSGERKCNLEERGADLSI